MINHALLVADVEAGGQVLPEYDNLIIDEAHHLENAATDQFTRQVDLRILASLLDSVAEAVSNLPPRFSHEIARSLVSKLEAGRRSLQATVPGFFDLLLDFALRHRDERPDARRLSVSAKRLSPPPRPLTIECAPNPSGAKSKSSGMRSALNSIKSWNG